MPWLLALVFAIVALAALLRVRRLVAKHEHRGCPIPWPIRRVEPADFDAIFTITEHGPSHQTLVRFSSSMGVLGGTSDREAWILSVLATKSRTIFEFGTCTGKTTHLLALNAPEDAIVHTLTLAHDQQMLYSRSSGDDAHDTRAALREGSREIFVYSNTPEARKVRQLYGDSKAFDHSPYTGRCDLIFVDGSHALSYVQSDSDKALEMIAPGGVIIWHDYRGPHKPRGVYKALNALARRLPLVHIAGTSLVAYRRPRA